jgi:hypothetical protein
MRASELIGRLSENFCADVLTAVSHDCLAVQEWTRNPASMLLVHFACADIATAWEEPVTSEQADTLRAAYLPLLTELLSAVTDQDTARTLVASDTLARLLRPPA